MKAWEWAKGWAQVWRAWERSYIPIAVNNSSHLNIDVHHSKMVCFQPISYAWHWNFSNASKSTGLLSVGYSSKNVLNSWLFILASFPGPFEKGLETRLIIYLDWTFLASFPNDLVEILPNCLWIALIMSKIFILLRNMLDLFLSFLYFWQSSGSLIFCALGSKLFLVQSSTRISALIHGRLCPLTCTDFLGACESSTWKNSCF